MSKIPKHIVDEIMQTAIIEEVIGDFVQLKRAGSNLKGLSPFTDEKTPSFVVSPAKQIFKCFFNTCIFSPSSVLIRIYDPMSNQHPSLREMPLKPPRQRDVALQNR